MAEKPLAEQTSRDELLREILCEIDFQRQQLCKLSLRRVSLSDAAVVALSRRLDGLVNRYYRELDSSVVEKAATEPS